MQFAYGILSSIFFMMTMGAGGGMATMHLLQAVLIALYGIPTVLMHADIARRLRRKGQE